MKTNLFKSLLVAVMAIGAMGGVNAEETKTLVYSNDFETSSDFTKTGKDGGHFLNPGTTTLNSFGSKVIAVGGAAGDQGLMSPQFKIGDAQIVDIELKFKMDGCYDKKGSGLYFITAKNTLGWNNQKSIFSISAQAAGNGTWGTMTAGGVDIKNKVYSVGTNNHEFSMKGNRGTTGVVKLNLRLNFTTQQAIFSLSRTNGDVLIKEQKVPFENESNSLYGLFVHGGKSFGGNYVDDLKVWTVTSTEVTKTADYTIKYICEGQEIKNSLKYTGIVGEEISIKNSDKEDFYNEDNSIKYIYVSDDAASKTVAKDGSTVVTVTYREAAKYNYTVNNNINDYSVSGTAFEGDNAKVAFSQYILKDGVLYETNKIDDNRKQFNWTFAVNEDNTVKTINYKKTSINNVAYYSEGENIEGLTIINSGNSAVRSSNSASAYAKDADVVFTTLPAGKYKLTSSICDFKGRDASAEFSYKAGEKVIFTHKAEVINSDTKTSEEFTLNESTPISLVKGGNESQGVDFIYIQRTGDATETVSVTEAGYATYATKYNVEVPNDENVKVMTVKVNDDNSTITLNEIDANTVIPAGTGILVKAPAGNCDFVVTSDEGKELEHNSLVAAKEAVTSDGATFFALTKMDTKVGFAVVNNGVKIPAGKAYLKVPAATTAKFFGLDGEATGINSVKTAKADGAYYTLEGVKTTKPIKGLYIHNGKKIVVK